jgi:hypothetical protein
LSFGPEGKLAGELGRRLVERLVFVWCLVTGFVVAGFFMEGIEEQLLGPRDGLGVERGDLGRGLGLLGGALCLGGEEGAVAGGVGIALGDGGGDATGARGGGG